MKRQLAFSIALVLLGTLSVLGAVPQQINYQGYLTNTSGSPLDTTVAMTFKLYTDSTAGSLLWTEARPSVTVTDGLFNARLGQVTTLGNDVFNNAQVWLGITVGNNSEMIPRSRIVSVSYAYRVGTVDGAGGGTISGDVNIVGKANIGSGNYNTGAYAFVAGLDGTATGNYSVVGGGRGNVASELYSTVSGGHENYASDSCTTVSGGRYNAAGDTYATVAGGYGNYASHYGATIGGGYSNEAIDMYATVGGGNDNTADYGATVAGGERNEASGNHATVSGGDGNVASGNDATVGGGDGNVASHSYATVGGGYQNTVSGWDASFGTVGGGSSNAVFRACATVGGGANNTASGDGATVGGGGGNTASHLSATVCGGSGNSVSGAYSTIAGGADNICSGDGTFVCGNNANAVSDSSFVFNDGRYDGTIGQVGQPRRFIAIASNGTYFYSNQSATLGAALPANATAWTPICDSTKKVHYGRVNTKDVLQKVAQLPIETWSYKDDPNHIRHMGPMAQDFYSLFNLGESDTTISTLDPDGIALAAIQELNKKIEEMQVLKEQNADLEDRVARLELLLQQLCGRGNHSVKQASFTNTTQ